MGLLKDEKNAPTRPHQLGQYLPYFEFDDDPDSRTYRAHLLKDGSLGMCWKAKVPASYSYDSGELQTINELRTFLEGLPQAYEVQISVTSQNDLSQKMRHYLSQNSGSDRAKILRSTRAQMLMEAGFYGYQVSENGYSLLRDTYMVISLRAPQALEQMGLVGTAVNSLYQVAAMALSPIGINMSKYLGNYLEQTLRPFMSDFYQTIISAESTLNSMFEIERMSLEDLKEHYWTAYCPSFKEQGQKIVIDKERPFNEQVIPVPIESDYNIVKMGDDYQGIIMLAMMPDAVGPDYLGVIRRTLATQYTVFCNIAQANQVMEKVALSMSAALRQRVASVFSKEEAQVYAQETSDVKTRMFGGRRVMYMMLGVVVHGISKQDVEDKLLRLNSEFKKLSVVPDIENSMSLQAISYSWPLVWRNEYTKPFARTRRVISDDLVDLLPIHGHWGGHEDAQAVYVNRDGEITFFDHTSNDFVNWHYAITGTSGSGKSVAVVDLTLQLYAAGVKKQYLMTIKDDYDRFAHTMGKLIVIDLDNQDACINPFAGEITKQRLQQWSTVVELMLRKGGDVESGRDEQRLIEQVVQFAYELVPEDDVLRPTWIKESFYKFPYVSEEQRRMGMQDAEEIGSFCADGVYGKLFDAPPAITEDDDIVVFNLQNVLSEKISDVIVYSIFSMLDNVMYTGDRKEKKHLLVDEMVSMVSAKGGEAVASQLKRAFRTYRSLNCMCGIASQNEEDLTTDVGQAIIGNVTKRMLLKPKREMIALLTESMGLKTSRHKANIESLETRAGFYSEFYLTSPHGEVVCRLLLDKLSYALATTTPDDVVEIERIRQENDGDWWLAALKFADTYPHGVRVARAAEKRRLQQEIE